MRNKKGNSPKKKEKKRKEHYSLLVVGFVGNHKIYKKNTVWKINFNYRSYEKK